MLVASLLSAPLLDRLVEVVEGISAELVKTTSWRELSTVLRTQTVHIAVVDPIMGGEQLAKLLTCYPSTLMIAYSELTKPAIESILYLSKYGLQEVVLHPYDDACGLFSAKLSRAYSYQCHSHPHA